MAPKVAKAASRARKAWMKAARDQLHHGVNLGNAAKGRGDSAASFAGMDPLRLIGIEALLGEVDARKRAAKARARKGGIADTALRRMLERRRFDEDGKAKSGRELERELNGQGIPVRRERISRLLKALSSP